MDIRQAFLDLMSTHTEIALATCAGDAPNVRLVNFCYDAPTKSILFTSFPDNDKVAEFARNPRVAFTTVPKEGIAHVKGGGVVRKSPRLLADVAPLFVAKIPDYDQTLEQVGDILVLFEIPLGCATVTLDFDHIETIPV